MNVRLFNRPSPLSSGRGNEATAGSRGIFPDGAKKENSRLRPPKPRHGLHRVGHRLRGAQAGPGGCKLLCRAVRKREPPDGVHPGSVRRAPPRVRGRAHPEGQKLHEPRGHDGAPRHAALAGPRDPQPGKLQDAPHRGRRRPVALDPALQRLRPEHAPEDRPQPQGRLPHVRLPAGEDPGGPARHRVRQRHGFPGPDRRCGLRVRSLPGAHRRHAAGQHDRAGRQPRGRPGLRDRAAGPGPDRDGRQDDQPGVEEEAERKGVSVLISPYDTSATSWLALSRHPWRTRATGRSSR